MNPWRIEDHGSPKYLSTVAVVAMLGVSLVAGCGGDTLPMGQVTGRVTYQGRPVTGGVIVFVPQRGPQATAVLDDKGRYDLITAGKGDGAPLGPQSVYFTPLFEDNPLADYTAQDYASGKLPPKRESLLKLPDTYLSTRTSGLTAEVKSGPNTVDFDLR